MLGRLRFGPTPGAKADVAVVAVATAAFALPRRALVASSTALSVRGTGAGRAAVGSLAATAARSSANNRLASTSACTTTARDATAPVDEPRWTALTRSGLGSNLAGAAVCRTAVGRSAAFSTAASGPGKEARSDEEGDAVAPATAGGQDEPAAEQDGVPMWRRAFNRFFGLEESLQIRAARPLVDICVDQAGRKEFYQAVGLAENYRSWYAISTLHVWLFLSRLRMDGDVGHEVMQAMVDRFWLVAEEKVRQSGISSETIVAKSVKDLLKQFYGSMVAYDEGLMGTDAQLAEALWRNFFACDVRSADDLQRMVVYVRGSFKQLEAGDRDLFLSGSLKWEALP